MKIIKKFMTRNDCYQANEKIEVKGILVHSTATPGVMADEWFDMWNKSYNAGETNRRVCVHAFLDDEKVMQYLPWDHRGWHGGGTVSNTHIGFEICEPAGLKYDELGASLIDYDVEANEEYFRKIFKNAVDLCVLLCKKFNLTENNIITHCEAHKMGIGSNHADVMHWFPKHGESMDTFREAVRLELNKN